ncbi:MAG: hypothetical protein AAGC46_09725 [Solirubrobacteraceae bacterium]
MSLSVLCPTRDPGPRVRALLEPLRAIADEIVVAADSTAAEEHLGHYAAVSDRVLRYDRGPRHSSLAWLHAQCRGDWILLLAGDEVVSGDLLDAFPDLTSRRDAQQVSFSMRWLWPDTGHWLAGAPWFPDFQTRLVRNDATLRFRGRVHELARPTQPARFSDLPIWHLSLLTSAVDARRAKVAANVATRPGLLAPGGGELNATYYLPEDHHGPALARVPPDERARRDAVLHASGGALPSPSIPVSGRDQIDPLWAQRPIDESVPLRCRIEVLDPTPVRMVRGQSRTLYARVHNDGPEPWAWGLDALPAFRLGVRWRGDDLPAEGRAGLPCDVPVDSETIVPVHVMPPDRTGRFTLELDMVLDPVRWFGHALDVAVDVVA